MAHTASPAGAASRESPVQDRWLRDAERRYSAQRLTSSALEEGLRGAVFGHVELRLRALRCEGRELRRLARLIAVIALVGCNALALLAFGTAMAADTSGALLPFGLSPSTGRVVSLLSATVPAYVFIRLLRFASGFVSARARELRELEGQYLAYAGAVVSGNGQLLDRAIQGFLDGGEPRCCTAVDSSHASAAPPEPASGRL